MKIAKFYTDINSLNFVDEGTLNEVCPMSAMFMFDTSQRAYGTMHGAVAHPAAELSMNNIRQIEILEESLVRALQHGATFDPCL